MQTDRALLAELTRIILDDKQDGKRLRPEILAIKDIFDRLCEDFKQDQAVIACGETQTAQGLALSPTMAAMCLEDYYRTIIYLRGLNAAIAAAKAKYPARPVRVLYVGTGPYAILAIPLMATYRPDYVKFELLDIHAPSVAAATSIITHLGLSDFLSAFHHMDAMDYTPDKAAMPDIIIAEIMLAGLEAEPQVAVTRYLTQQMPSSLFLPQSIHISAVTYEPPKQCLGSAFSFDKKMFGLSANQDNTLPAMTLNIPENIDGMGPIFLETQVQVYGQHILEPYDSGLTTWRILNCEYKAGETVNLVYKMGDRPGLIRAI